MTEDTDNQKQEQPIKKPEKDSDEPDYKKAVLTLKQKLTEKPFLRQHDINFHNAQKVLMIMDSILSNKDMEWVDGNVSLDKFTMPECPKHGIAPIHYCIIGMHDPKTKKPRGKCYYFDGFDVNGKCVAKDKDKKRYPDEPKYTHEEAFMIESKYRKNDKVVQNDFETFKGITTAQAAKEGKTGQAGVFKKKQKRNSEKSDKDYLPGNPQPTKS